MRGTYILEIENGNSQAKGPTVQKLKDFDSLFKTGYRSKHPEFLVVYSQDLTLSELSQAAVIASKKAVNKRAVLRNRTKRRLRALMQKFAESHDYLPSRWCLLGNKNTATCDWAGLEKSIQKFADTLSKPKPELNALPQTPPQL